MLTKKLLALAAVVLFAGVAVAGLTRAADMPKASKGDCHYAAEGDTVCPDQGTNFGPQETPRNWEGQGGGTE